VPFVANFERRVCIAATEGESGCLESHPKIWLAAGLGTVWVEDRRVATLSDASPCPREHFAGTLCTSVPAVHCSCCAGLSACLLAVAVAAPAVATAACCWGSGCWPLDAVPLSKGETACSNSLFFLGAERDCAAVECFFEGVEGSAFHLVFFSLVSIV
jgi:hypothetical protein